MKEAKETVYKVINLSSSAFGNNELIPAKYTCDGLNVSPPLQIGGIPPEAKSLALIVDDPDAPRGTWVHWVIWNIPVTIDQINENEAPGVQGMNDFHRNEYGGPCPPSGTHRYFFKLYALDKILDAPAGTPKLQLGKYIDDHIIGYGELIGLYKRS